MGQKVIEFQGKTYEFGPGVTDAQISEILAGPSKPEAPKKPERSTVQKVGDFIADLGIGAVKGAANTALDITPLSMLPAGKPGGVTPFDAARIAAKTEGIPQKIGTFIPDLAMMAATGGGTAATRSTGEAALRSAMPGLTREGAELAARNTAGRVSAGNVARWAQAAKPTTLSSGVISTPNATIRNVAQSMATAAGKSKSLVDDLIAGSAGGFFGGKNWAAAVTALRLLNRPGVKSAIGQGLYSTAPAIGPVAATGGLEVAREVFDELERQRRGGR